MRERALPQFARFTRYFEYSSVRVRITLTQILTVRSLLQK
jgi:hypothetical protein